MINVEELSDEQLEEIKNYYNAKKEKQTTNQDINTSE
jgi:cytochrome c553